MCKRNNWKQELTFSAAINLATKDEGKRKFWKENQHIKRENKEPKKTLKEVSLQDNFEQKNTLSLHN